MSTSNRKVVSIKQKPAQKTLSKAQKQFNSLIKQIDAHKKLLLEWKTSIPLYQKKVAEEYDVLLDAYNAKRIELAHLLDRAYEDRLFKKRDKDKIRHIITEITTELLHEQGEEVKDLYNKYSDSDFDADVEEQDALAGDLMKAMAQAMFNVDIPDDADMSSPEKMQAILKEKLQEQMEKDAETQRQAAERNSNRKKTAKQLEREAKQQQEAQNISKSIQDVYRKLVQTLHPDREQDPVERERKTAMMQRVNTAYGKKDLLQLLELQLEIEQIDQTQLNNIAEDRLKYFNKILKEQVAELTQEIEEIEYTFKLNLSLPPFQSLSPKWMMQALQSDIRELEKDIRGLGSELEAFQDFTVLKRWLKSYQIPKEEFDALDDLFFEGFEQVFTPNRRGRF